MIEDILLKWADLGFSYAVSMFLLITGWKQHEKYITVLTQLKDVIVQHVAEKEKLIQMIEAKITNMKP